MRLRRGGLIRLHQGVYAVGHRHLTEEGVWAAALLSFGPDSALSHRTAAQVWRLVPRAQALVEITRPTTARSRSGVRAHRAPLPPDEVVADSRLRITSMPRTLLDLAAVLPKRQLERALHEAEVRRLTDRLSLPTLLERYPRRRGAANLRALLEAKTPPGITQNDLEELFVEFLDAHRLPRPLLNATLPIRGRMLKPDCMWPGERLIVELDGRAVHGTERAFEGDRQRDRILLAEGWQSTRVTWRQLHGEPAAIAADLRQLLRHRGGPPTL